MAPIHILCIHETKLDETFRDAKFMIENYQFLSFRSDRNRKRGGKIVFIVSLVGHQNMRRFSFKSYQKQ